MSEKIKLEVTEDELWVIKMALNRHASNLNKYIREQMAKELEATCKEEERAQRLKKSFLREKELTKNILERLKNAGSTCI